MRKSDFHPGHGLQIAALAAILALAVTAALAAPGAGTTPDEELAPEERHERVGEIATQFIQKSHYVQIAVDDELSARVLDRYIESLDRNRMYLLQSDIDFFSRYRHRLDDMVRSEPLDPVYDMFKVYRTRMRERLEFALQQLDTEPDFTVDEEFRFDRTEAPWGDLDGGTRRNLAQARQERCAEPGARGQDMGRSAGNARETLQAIHQACRPGQQ